MKTIQEVLDWLQESENNGIYTCGTQNVKRHLESVQKHEALSQHDVVERSEQLVCSCELPSSDFELDDGTICCCRCEKTIAN